MIDKGDGDRLQKQQQRDNLRDVIQYCENKVDCRRVLVLQYFGEKFDKTECNRTCDNCERTTKVTIIDRTAYALKALKLAQNIDDRYTLNSLLDAFRGSAAKKILKYQYCEGYGAGRELSRTEAERILQSMATNQVFRTHNETNAGGFTTSYLKLGNKWKDLQNGKMKITLTVCEEESIGGPRKSYDNSIQTKKAKSTCNNVTSATKTNTNKRKTPIIEDDDEEEEYGYLDEFNGESESEIEDQISDSDSICYEEERGNNSVPSSPVYNATSFNSHSRGQKNNFVSLTKLAPEYQSILHRGEVSSMINVDAEKLRKSNENNNENKNNNINTVLNIPSNSAPSGVCYDYLIQWRDRIAQEKKLNAAFVLTNSVLGQIARLLPADFEELKKIPGMSDEKVSKYGPEIISITNKYIL